MKWSQLRTRWTIARASVARRWARLDDRDLRVIAGQRDRLVGILQERYAAPRGQIDRQVRSFTRTFKMGAL